MPFADKKVRVGWTTQRLSEPPSLVPQQRRNSIVKGINDEILPQGFAGDDTTRAGSDGIDRYHFSSAGRTISGAALKNTVLHGVLPVGRCKWSVGGVRHVRKPLGCVRLRFHIVQTSWVRNVCVFMGKIRDPGSTEKGEELVAKINTGPSSSCPGIAVRGSGSILGMRMRTTVGR